MGNVSAKFERLKIGREASQNSRCYSPSAYRSYGVLYDPHGPKSHKHASRRGNLWENFHSYVCTELLVEGHSVQRNNTAAISAICDMLSACTKQATPICWVTCTRTKARALESLPSIKNIWEATLKLPRSWWLSVESAGRFTSFLASFSANPRLL